jgi:hypothetical protein
MSNEIKQTAVEWLVKQLQSNSDIRWRGTNIYELGEQAKGMEYNEGVNTFDEGYSIGYSEGYKRALDYMTNNKPSTKPTG